jgi:YD repeat-containing protein
MKPFLLTLSIIIGYTSSAQFYYKDIIGNRESSEMIKNYMKNKVNRVLLASYNANNEKDDQFYVEQQFDPSTRSLKTITRSGITNQSVLISYADANGNVIKTIDSSEIVVTVTDYQYNASGQLISLTTSSSDTSSTRESEQHIWEWSNNHPVKMLRIKNKLDTAYVEFVIDEKGNIAEERETRKKIKLQPIYYYYNENNLLSDIVRYSPRAKQLMAEYIFEYSDSNQVIQKITIPSNNSNYLFWRYQYDTRGLKVKEKIFDKQKQLTGTIEYQYSFAS